MQNSPEFTELRLKKRQTGASNVVPRACHFPGGRKLEDPEDDVAHAHTKMMIRICLLEVGKVVM